MRWGTYLIYHLITWLKHYGFNRVSMYKYSNCALSINLSRFGIRNIKRNWNFYQSIFQYTLIVMTENMPKGKYGLKMRYSVTRYLLIVP